MERLSRSRMLMGIALVTAERGTCSRLQVGAVFSKDGRILVNGYNGAVKGQPHCDHTCTCSPTVIRSDSRVKIRRIHEDECPADPGMGCSVAQHAERNAIDFAARHGLALEGSDLHVTHMPCLTCAGSLINAGVEVVSYLYPYRLTEGVELLEAAGVKVLHMEPWT